MQEESMDWELHKENVLPLSRGRDPVKIETVMSSKKPGLSHSRSSELEHKKKSFEQQIEKNDGEDPLETWLSYIKWTQEEFISDTNESFKVLEKCTRRFSDVKSYSQDPRYLKTWIAYANLLSNPGDLFKYLHKNEIGTSHSLFWKAWALVTEKQGNYVLTEKIITKGIKSGAAPPEEMVKRHREFLRRMNRLWINIYIGEEEQEAASQSGSAAFIQTPFNSSNVESADEERKALQDLTDHIMGTRDQNRLNAQSSQPQQSRSQGAAHHHGASSQSLGSNRIKTSSNINNQGGFAIFVEEDFRQGKPSKRVAEAYDLENIGDGAWSALPSQKESTKENTVEAGQWNNQGFGKEQSSLPIASQPVVRRTQIPIFVEEQFQEEKKGVLSDSSVADTQGYRRGLVQRDKPIPSTEIEKLSVDPLRNLKKDAKQKQSEAETLVVRYMATERKTEHTESSHVPTTENPKEAEKAAQDDRGVESKGSLEFGFDFDSLKTSAEATIEELCFEELRMMHMLSKAAAPPQEDTGVVEGEENDIEMTMNEEEMASETPHVATDGIEEGVRRVRFEDSSSSPVDSNHFQLTGAPRQKIQQEEGYPEKDRVHGRLFANSEGPPTGDEKEHSLVKNVSGMNDDGMTINTKVALQELGLFFASPDAHFDIPLHKKAEDSRSNLDVSKKRKALGEHEEIKIASPKTGMSGSPSQTSTDRNRNIDIYEDPDSPDVKNDAKCNENYIDENNENCFQENTKTNIKGKQATSKKLVFQELPVPAAVYSDSENSVEDDDVREPSAFKPRKLTNRDFLSSFIGRDEEEEASFDQGAVSDPRVQCHLSPEHIGQSFPIFYDPDLENQGNSPKKNLDLNFQIFEDSSPRAERAGVEVKELCKKTLRSKEYPMLEEEPDQENTRATSKKHVLKTPHTTFKGFESSIDQPSAIRREDNTITSLIDVFAVEDDSASFQLSAHTASKLSASASLYVSSSSGSSVLSGHGGLNSTEQK